MHRGSTARINVLFHEKMKEIRDRGSGRQREERVVAGRAIEQNKMDAKHSKVWYAER